MTTQKDFSKLPKKSADKKSKKNSDKEIIDHLSRLIKLMITLNNGVLNLHQAAQECGVSKRTINRDIKILEKAGIPLYKPNEQNANYRLRPDFELSKFSVTEKNARDFADFLDVLADTFAQPKKFILPIQKEVVKAGKAAQAKRKKAHNAVSFKATDELLASVFLADEAMEQKPYLFLLQAWEANRLFTPQDKNLLYGAWQDTQLMQTGARFAWLNRQYKSALSFCDMLIKKDPKDAWAYRQAALICYTDKDYRTALKYVLEGLTENTTDKVLYFYFIYLVTLDKKYQDAIQLFNDAVKSKFWQTHFYAMLYAYAGEFDKSLTAVEEALRQDPKNDGYKQLKQTILKHKNEAAKNKK